VPAHATVPEFPVAIVRFKKSAGAKMSPPSENAQASNNHINPMHLVKDNETEIMNKWVNVVMQKISAAGLQSRAEIANHLQDMLDNIVSALTSLGDDLDPAIVNELSAIGETSKEHGRDRASIKNYTVGNIVLEYILLRQVINEVCTAHAHLDVRSTEIINRAIENASVYAVNEFMRVTEEIQQKLVGSLVHDVRTPLGVAYKFAEMLAHPSVSEDVKDQATRTIGRNLKRAVEMLEELLDFMKIRGGIGLLLSFQEGDLNAPLRSVCSEADKIYSSEVIYRSEGHQVQGVFDTVLILRSVENLVSNGIKHGYPNRPVTVILADCGDHVSIQVHNEGKPISDADLETIFDSFSQGGHSNRTKSWGLGLTLIKTVARCHGGNVNVTSNKENGTTFTITLRKRHRKHGDEEVMRI
jgi:signal transduction histidine kinase